MSNIDITMAVFMVASIVCLVCGVLSLVSNFFYENGVTIFFSLVGLFAFVVMVVAMECASVSCVGKCVSFE